MLARCESTTLQGSYMLLQYCPTTSRYAKR